jgi:hypothetical protein
MQVRPWGFWNPVLQKVRTLYPEFEPNKNFARDAFNVFIGIIWQTSLVITPIALVTQQHVTLAVSAGIVAATSVTLKFTWWDKLDMLSKDTLPEDFDQRIAKAYTGADPILEKV